MQPGKIPICSINRAIPWKSMIFTKTLPIILGKQYPSLFPFKRSTDFYCSQGIDFPFMYGQTVTMVQQTRKGNIPN